MLSAVGIDPGALGLGTDLLNPGDREGRVYLSWTGAVKGLRGDVREAWSLFSSDSHLLTSESFPGPARNAAYDLDDDPLERSSLEDSQRREELSAQLATGRQGLLEQREDLPAPLAVHRELPRSLLLELVALGYAVGEPKTIEEVHALIQEENVKALRMAAAAKSKDGEQGEEAHEGREDARDAEPLNPVRTPPHSHEEDR